MGIYIPGMKMPKDEKAIHLEIHSDGTVLMWQMGDDDKVIGTAIELPPHGRLKDADALIGKAYQPGAYGYVDAIQIANATTIIPAEGGADNG